MKSERFAKLIGTALLAAALLFTGCSMTKESETSEEACETFSDIIGTGTVSGYEYTLKRPDEYGPRLNEGWYTRDSDDEKYVLICRGEKSSGGYGIEVTSVDYDEESDTVVITVRYTRDTEVVTDNITYPCCSVYFDKLPENIKVICEPDTTLKYLGNLMIKTKS